MTTPSQPDVFLALADKHRREILQVLMEQPSSINAIAEQFLISRPAVSKHIKLLETSGFIHYLNIFALAAEDDLFHVGHAPEISGIIRGFQ